MESQESQQEIQQPTPELPPSIQPRPSPLWPQHLIDLFIRPRKFFAGQLALGKTPYVILVTWCYGISSAIDRIDRELIRAELGSPRPGWDQFGPLITESWLGFWVTVLLLGVIGGLFLWWIGGWWYRVRVRWSGVNEPDKRLARLLFVYSSFVHSGPAVALAVAMTMAYPNYAQAYSSDEPYTLLLLVFPFWSVITSYAGVRTLFQVSRWKARIWFVILPCLFYIMVFGVIAIFYAFLAG